MIFAALKNRRQRRQARRVNADFENLAHRRDYYQYPPRQPERGTPIVNAEALMSIPWVWRCVNLTAGRVARMPLRRISDLGAPPEFWAQPTDRRAYTGFHLLRDTMVNLQVHGNAYWVVLAWDDDMQPALVEPVWPNLMTVQRDLGGRLVYRPYNITSQDLTDEDVLHFRGPAFAGADCGMSPVAFMAETGRMGLLQRLHAQASLMGRNADRYWSTERQAPPPYLDEITSRIDDAWGGRSDKELVIGAGITGHTMGLTPEQLELLESRRLTAVEICAGLGVPPSLLGVALEGATQTYSNVQQDLALYDRTTLDDYRGVITETIGCYWRQPLEMSNIDLTRPTMQERYQAYAIGLQGGWLTREMIAEMEGLPMMPDTETEPDSDASPSSDTDDNEDDTDDDSNVIPMTAETNGP